MLKREVIACQKHNFSTCLLTSLYFIYLPRINAIRWIATTFQTCFLKKPNIFSSFPTSWKPDIFLHFRNLSILLTGIPMITASGSVAPTVLMMLLIALPTMCQIVSMGPAIDCPRCHYSQNFWQNKHRQLPPHYSHRNIRLIQFQFAMFVLIFYFICALIKTVAWSTDADAIMGEWQHRSFHICAKSGGSQQQPVFSGSKHVSPFDLTISSAQLKYFLSSIRYLHL